jgi:hypothetical protein
MRSGREGRERLSEDTDGRARKFLLEMCVYDSPLPVYSFCSTVLLLTTLNHMYDTITLSNNIGRLGGLEWNRI